MFHIEVDTEALDRMARVLEASDAQVEKARTSALRKIRVPIRKAVLSAAAKKLRVPQKALAGRVFTSDVPDGAEEMQIWFGTWSVSPFEIGTPKQTKSGVSVGRLRYPGAFIARIYSAREKIWIRLNSKHYSSELYPTRHRSGDRGIGEMGRGRFPVVRAAMQIDGVVQQVLASQGDEFAERFMKIFAGELNYYVNVRGAN